MWTRDELEKLSTQRLYNMYKQHRSYAAYPFAEEWEDRGELLEELELMKNILDKREHLERKDKKPPQGKRKRGTKNTAKVKRETRRLRRHQMR